MEFTPATTSAAPDVQAQSESMSQERRMRVLDMTYQRFASDWASRGLSRQDQMRETTKFVKVTGVIPDSLKSSLSGALNSLDPEAAYAGAEVYDSLVRESPPGAIEKLSPSDRAFAGTIMALTSAYGGDYNRAVKDAIEARRTKNMFGGDVIESQFEQLMQPNGDFGNHLLMSLSQKIGYSALKFDELPRGLLAEWQEVARVEFMRSQDKSFALSAADAAVMGKYELNPYSGQVEPYPITKVYKVNGDAQWAVNQVADRVVSLINEDQNRELMMLVKPQVLTIQGDVEGYKKNFPDWNRSNVLGDMVFNKPEIRLEFVPGTERQLDDGSPGHAYIVTVLGNDGMPYRLRTKDGDLAVIRPNYTTSPEGQQAIKRKQEEESQRRASVYLRMQGALPP